MKVIGAASRSRLEVSTIHMFGCYDDSLGLCYWQYPKLMIFDAMRKSRGAVEGVSPN
jgi:hypothetical protein